MVGFTTINAFSPSSENAAVTPTSSLCHSPANDDRSAAVGFHSETSVRRVTDPSGLAIEAVTGEPSETAHLLGGSFASGSYRLGEPHGGA